MSASVVQVNTAHFFSTFATLKNQEN